MARTFVPSIRINHDETVPGNDIIPSPDSLMEEGTEVERHSDGSIIYRWNGVKYRFVPNRTGNSGNVELLSNKEPLPSKWDIVKNGKVLNEIDKTGAKIIAFGKKKYHCLPVAGADGDDWEVRVVMGRHRQGFRFINSLSRELVA